MKKNARIFCVEAHDGNDPLLQAVERLYLATQHPDERIPWGWIARSLKGRASWRPGAAGYHLLTALPEEQAHQPEALAGFAYGMFLPEYGGYVSYLGVAEAYRKRGVGTRLMKQMVKVLDSSAGAIDEPLPFVIWESKRPAADAPAHDQRLWLARTQLFDRVGAYWIEGLRLFTPNYGEPNSKPVELELFVKPVDRSREGFTPEALRELGLGLLCRVYRMSEQDPLFEQTAQEASQPRLRPAREACRILADNPIPEPVVSYGS